ncbi:nitronate monooxygenase [Romboutsia maritimum]|uniref:Probable nitronate monooxygenase n=1 Tax=Romboutsia maritimum TaxID=2020948 RepID=A0A371ISR9_9FIRM|nr:nitronate monooxygenase family protein [Romboutsia maritimum]RDY23522.1 nitronate monooxygenase [Romboutsia maritimum]
MVEPLIIGDLVAKVPIIQGGMGIGVSRSSLASAVAKAGGIGIISGVQIGYDEDDFENNCLAANLRALKKHIEIAKANSNDGIIGINLMVAMNHYEEFVMESIKCGVDIIISGAGLPIKLASLAKDSNVKICPIVSSAKAANLILKTWDKKNNTTADLIVVEGPKAGGHLGYNKNDLENLDSIDYEGEFTNILEIVKIYEKKYNKKIPVIAAGGISSGKDVKKFIDMGASGVQVGTRFVTTYECDAHENFKLAYVNATEKDIQIVKSPVGLPGRAINNKFLEKINSNTPKIAKCYNCLVSCNPKTTPYCISTALINAAKGDIDNALLFCGHDAYKINELSSVSQVIDELISEL